MKICSKGIPLGKANHNGTNFLLLAGQNKQSFLSAEVSCFALIFLLLFVSRQKVIFKKNPSKEKMKRFNTVL